MSFERAPQQRGDVDYEELGEGYAFQRRTDPRIAAQIHHALGAARTVLNVGAGAGSYEPEDRYVLALEPSAAMRAQRPPYRVPAIEGYAERIPLDDQAVDAAMAIITVHQWTDLAQGLREMRRVTRGALVIMTFDPDALERFWLADYAPELIAVERRRYPTLETLREQMGGPVTVEPIAIPADCVDGFSEAFYARPERLLDPAVRRAQSAWSFVDAAVQRRVTQALAADLQSGVWDQRYGKWRRMPELIGSLRLLVGQPAEDPADR